jgi:hypothetical protein
MVPAFSKILFGYFRAKWARSAWKRANYRQLALLPQVRIALRKPPLAFAEFA